MKQSPSWEADSHSGSQEILRLLWNPKEGTFTVFTRTRHWPLSWARWIQSTRYPFNIILPSAHRSPKHSLPFRYSDQNSLCISNLSIRATCPTYIIVLSKTTY